MFPGYTPKNPEPENTGTNLGGMNASLRSTFFGGTTKNMNVIENRFMQQTVNIANDPNDVEVRLQASVLMKRVRIEEFFRDFDKLRKGKVTIPQFKSILSMMKFNLTEEEFESLANRYRTDDPEGMFNYSAFCHNINLVFTQKGIDKNPTLTVKPISSDDTYMARRKYLDVASDE